MKILLSQRNNKKNSMRVVKEYVLEKGCPMALYVDKDSIYKTKRAQTIEETTKRSLSNNPIFTNNE